MAQARRQQSGHGQQPYQQRAQQQMHDKQVYVYGNAVTQPDYRPEPKREPQPIPKVDRQIKKNRRRALNINAGYAVFLTVAAICTVMVCVFYLQLQSNILNRSAHISTLQEQLVELKEANTSSYHAILDSVNLEKVRAIAINEMGMVFAAYGHVIEFPSPTEIHVFQHNEIPTNGIL